MIIFKNKEEDNYLITNYKVMFSTLNNQNNLIRQHYNRALYLKILFSRLPFSKTKFYLLVRDPFKRIESFYKDKFLRAEKSRLYKIKIGKPKLWEECTEHFFPYLGLNTSMAPELISKKLTSIKFEEVMSILPEVFMKDGHMFPQHNAKQISIKKFGMLFKIPINFEKIYKLESQKDLMEMAKVFNIDINIKHNNSNSNTELIDWSAKSIEITEKIYRKDFEYFGYEKKSKTPS